MGEDGGGGGGKVYTLAEVSQHATSQDCWLVIDGKVYDVTKFMDDHPGGDEVLLQSTGKDATEDFDDVGHSKSARKMLDDFYVGEIDKTTVPEKKSHKTSPAKLPQTQTNQDNSSDFLVKILQFLVPLIILGLALAVRFYTKTE